MNIENEVLYSIWKDRYSKNGESIDDNLHRVASYCSTNEQENEEFYKLLDKGLFYPAGRTMSNSGIGRTLTLNNCFNLNNVPDSIEDIFNYIKYGALTQKAGGGTGYNFSLIRPAGTKTSNDAIASGVISFMDTFNSQTHTIISGSRRGANMGILMIYHPDILDYLESKSFDEGKLVHFNLSVMVDDEFMKAKEEGRDIWLHYPCMTLDGKLVKDESEWKIKRKINARELWDLIMRKAYDTGEYGVFFYENLNKDNNLWYMENITGTNPCFTADMKLLTAKGYTPIGNLENKRVKVVNEYGHITEGKVWCSGEKETVKVKLANIKEITCTPNHIFKTIDNIEVEAKDLKGLKLMPRLAYVKQFDEEFIKLGFIQGDGQTTRLNDKYHAGIEVNIGVKDEDVKELFNEPLQKDNRSIYTTKYTTTLIILGFSRNELPHRVLPSSYSNWNYLQKSSFLQGCFSANGSVIKNTRVSYKTTCKKFAEELVETLEKDFNITSYITTNKSHDVKFENGIYTCKESYDVNIHQYDSLQTFHDEIGFYHKYKKTALNELLIARAPKVISVKPNGIEKVYDFNEPETHWGIVEGFVVHNCGEYVSGVLFGEDPKTHEQLNPLDYMGACNLGSLFLQNFVKNPFTKNVSINHEELKHTINIAVKWLDNIIDINTFPLKQYENYQKNIRTIGLGFTGLADVLAMFNLVYGSPEAIKFTDDLTNTIAKESYIASIDLAREKGHFNFLDKEKFAKSNFIQKHAKKDKEWNAIKHGILKYGIRNARLISIAPTGTLSLAYGNNCSSGLEPIFSLSYNRKVKLGGQDDKDIKIVKMEDYAYKEWLKVKDSPDCIVKEDVFVTAMDLPVDAHLNMLKTIAFNTDMACSKTINIPTDYSFEDTKKVYDKCHEFGIKGCTIFRPNEIRQGILINDKPKEESKGKLPRGVWKPKAKDTSYTHRKVRIGCGKITLMVGWSNEEQEIQDFYVIRSGEGGCERNLQSTAISMSGMLRYGGNLDSIEKALSGVGGCTSFATQRAKGNKLSPGNNCGTAIIREIKKFASEMENNNRPKTPENAAVPFTEEELKFKNENGPIAFALKYNRCPNCGRELEHSGGCISCVDCGFTKCE